MKTTDIVPIQTPSLASFRWLSFGAGAIGTYIGGNLLRAGHQVVFLEKPEIAEILNQRGLHLNLSGNMINFHSPIITSSIQDALRLGPFDVAIFALKSFDTHKALETIRPVIKLIPPILCLQNGVENEQAIGDLIGAQSVIAGSLTSAVGRIGPGDIVLERLRGIAVADGNPISAITVKHLNNAGMNARLFPIASDMKWSKMLTNLVANASSAILDMSPSEIFSDSGLHNLEVEQLKEAITIMQTMKMKVVDLPGTPVRLLAFGATRLPTSFSKVFFKRAVGNSRGGKMPSLHIDLHNGHRQSEVDYLNGAVVRFGQSLGIPTPANNILNDTLAKLCMGMLPLESFRKNPAALLKLYHREYFKSSH